MAILVLLSYFLASREFALAVFLGGLIILANIYTLDWIFKRGFKPKERKDGKKLSPFFIWSILIKMGAVAVIVIVLIKYFKIDIVGFLIGASILFLSLLTDLLFHDSDEDISENKGDE
jgi:SNF family Na+-dependent transporter